MVAGGGSNREESLPPLLRPLGGEGSWTSIGELQLLPLARCTQHTLSLRQTHTQEHTFRCAANNYTHTHSLTYIQPCQTYSAAQLYSQMEQCRQSGNETGEREDEIEWEREKMGRGVRGRGMKSRRQWERRNNEVSKALYQQALSQTTPPGLSQTPTPKRTRIDRKQIADERGKFEDGRRREAQHSWHTAEKRRQTLGSRKRLQTLAGSHLQVTSQMIRGFR